MEWFKDPVGIILQCLNIILQYLRLILQYWMVILQYLRVILQYFHISIMQLIKIANSILQSIYCNILLTTPDHHHTFGSPVYVLKDKLQNLNSVGKWNQQAKIGIYLGQSPRHAQSIALALHPRTGLVSPQIHVNFDNNFTTIVKVNNNHGIWQKLAKFVKISVAKEITKREQTTTNPNLQQEGANSDTQVHEGATQRDEHQSEQRYQSSVLWNRHCIRTINNTITSF